MPNVIPAELRNQRGLKKLKDYYAEQLAQLKQHGGNESTTLKQLRSDIDTIERELVGKPLVAVSATRK